MIRSFMLGTAALALAASPAVFQGVMAQGMMAPGKPVKIGFVSTFSGPVAVIGDDMKNSFELALDHLGHKMGGRPVQMFYEDDGFKPEIGKQKSEELVQSDHVDFVSGFIWSNVLLASYKPIIDSKTFLIGSNAGPHQIAAELCSPYLFSTSWQNDQTPQAMGDYMNQKGVKTVFLIGPNYAAGTRHAGRRRRDLQGQGDRQGTHQMADRSSISPPSLRRRAPPIRTPSSCSIPATPGVQFLNQYAQAGLKGKIPLYTAFTIDETTLPLAEGSRAWRARRAGMGQRSAERSEQEVRRRLPQEVSRPRPVVLRRAVL